MIRHEGAIANVYNLGKVKPITQAQADVLNYLGGYKDGYNTQHWPFVDGISIGKESPDSLIDHVDSFTKAVTLIPYITHQEFEDKVAIAHEQISKNVCWQIAIQNGLKYQIELPDPTIYDNPYKFCYCTVVIILKADNWIKLRNAIRQYLNDIYNTHCKQEWGAYKGRRPAFWKCLNREVL